MYSFLPSIFFPRGLSRGFLIEEGFNEAPQSMKSCLSVKILWQIINTRIKINLSAKEEFTLVNPCREYNKKPLGEGRIHPSESLPRVQYKTSRPREFKVNLSTKEEFTQVNPYREHRGKTSRSSVRAPPKENKVRMILTKSNNDNLSFN